MELDPETDLTLSRTLNAPRSLLWTCWTSPAHLKQFFVPKPHSVEACEIELWVGGRFDTTMRIDGTLIESRGVFLEIMEEQRLVFTDTYSAGWKPAADPFMTAIIDFAEAGSGRTIYSATARHRSSQARQSHEDMGFHEGWGTVATQLEHYAQSLI